MGRGENQYFKKLFGHIDTTWYVSLVKWKDHGYDCTLHFCTLGPTIVFFRLKSSTTIICYIFAGNAGSY